MTTCDKKILIKHQLNGSGTLIVTLGFVLTNNHLVIKGIEEETDTSSIYAFPNINLTHLVTNLIEEPRPPHPYINIAEEPVDENTLLSPWGDRLEGN